MNKYVKQVLYYLEPILVKLAPELQVAKVSAYQEYSINNSANPASWLSSLLPPIDSLKNIFWPRLIC